MRSPALVITPLLLAAFHRLHFASADQVSFRMWYPQYGAIFQHVLETSCSNQYTAYVAGNASFVRGDADAADGTSTPGEAVVQCILNSTSEFIKANMQSAGVLLGIMPFALSVLGSSSEESALLFVLARRPLLTTLLLAGSPVVVALRPFEYKDPIDILRNRESRFTSVSVGPQWVVLLLEYSVVLASVVNVAHVTYQLGNGVVTMILPESNYLPALWMVTGIVVHIIGAICLRSRLRLQTPKGESVIQAEFTLSSRKTLTVETTPERKLFLILSWIVSTTTTFHVIFGTLAFSSMLFISVKDAFGVIGRYAASVTVCRVILMYELSGLRGSALTSEEVQSGAETAGPSDGKKKSVSRVYSFAP